MGWKVIPNNPSTFQCHSKVFSGLRASCKAQKWLKYEKNSYKLAAQGPKTPKIIALTGLSGYTNVVRDPKHFKG